MRNFARGSLLIVGLLSGSGCGAVAGTTQAPNSWAATVMLADGTKLDFQGAASLVVAPPTILGSFDPTQMWELELYWDPSKVNTPGAQSLTPPHGLTTLIFRRNGQESWDSTGGTTTFTQLSNDHGAIVSGTIDSATLVAEDASKTQVTIPTASFSTTMP